MILLLKSLLSQKDTFFWEEQVPASQGCTFIKEVRIECQAIRIRQKLSDLWMKRPSDVVRGYVVRG